MACFSLNGGIATDCENSMGGIKKVFLMDATVAATLSDAATTPQTITALEGTTASNTFEFNFRKNTGSMTSTLTVDAANGVNFVSTALVLQFTRMEAAKRASIAALVKSEVKAVVVDSNGTAWLLGFDEPVSVTEGTGQTGQAKTDGNFYSLTLTDESKEFPYVVDSKVVADLEALN